MRVLREPGGTVVGEACAASCSTPTTPSWASRRRSCSTRRAAPSSSTRSSDPRSRPARSSCATASSTPPPPTRATRAASTSRASTRSTRRRPAAWCPTARSCSTSTPRSASRARPPQSTDRLEAEDLALPRRVRDGFLAIAAQEPGRVRVIDASGSAEQVAERVGRCAGGPSRPRTLARRRRDDALRLGRHRRPGPRRALPARGHRRRSREPRVPVRRAARLRQGDGGARPGVRAPVRRQRLRRVRRVLPRPPRRPSRRPPHRAGRRRRLPRRPGPRDHPTT